MKIIKDTRFLIQINKNGGIIREMGHAYFYIIDNHCIIVKSAKDSINKLYEVEDETVIIDFDFINDIPKKYYDEILYNIKDSFGASYIYNFSNYDIFKKNLLKNLNNIKDRMNK
jgi:hypothetical protein